MVPEQRPARLPAIHGAVAAVFQPAHASLWLRLRLAAGPGGVRR